MGWELGVNRCKLLLLEWINNEILLYSTENYVSILTTEHDNGRKKYTSMCNWAPVLDSGKKNCVGGNNNKKNQEMEGTMLCL